MRPNGVCYWLVFQKIRSHDLLAYRSRGDHGIPRCCQKKAPCYSKYQMSPLSLHFLMLVLEISTENSEYLLWPEMQLTPVPPPLSMFPAPSLPSSFLYKNPPLYLIKLEAMTLALMDSVQFFAQHGLSLFSHPLNPFFSRQLPLWEPLNNRGSRFESKWHRIEDSKYS